MRSTWRKECFPAIIRAAGASPPDGHFLSQLSTSPARGKDFRKPASIALKQPRTSSVSYTVAREDLPVKVHARAPAETAADGVRRRTPLSILRRFGRLTGGDVVPSRRPRLVRL